MIVSTLLLVLAQAVAPLHFEVATIKPSSTQEAGPRYAGCQGTDNNAGTNVTIPLGRCIVRGLPLRLIIAYAYSVPGMQVNSLISGPPALDDAYDIEAKAEKPLPLEQMKQMFQVLLADRLKLAVHREKKDIDAFALLVDKNGSKLRAAPADRPCVDSSTKGPCHGFQGGRGRGLHGQSVNMADLAMNLTNWAGRMVVDRTQLKGLFDIETTPWTPDNPGPTFAAEAGTDPANLPTFFTMLQEQLGLRLEAKKETAELLIIDHVEKPQGER